ncbi:MAG: ATP-binding protein [Caldilineaceae bacterium]
MTGNLSGPVVANFCIRRWTLLLFAFVKQLGKINHTHSRRPPLVDCKMPNYVRFFLPLQAADSRLGVLKVGYEKSRWSHFNQDDITRLYTFADQVAIAVYNMQLLQRTEAALARSVRELEKLQDISRTLSTATNVNLIFREIIQAIQTLFPGSEVTMWEFGIATQQFKILESSIHDQTYRALVLDLATTTGVAVQQRKVIMRDHCRGEVHDVTWQIMQSLGLEKLVVVPMTSRGETLGAISLYVKREQQVDDTHQALLMAIAAQAASAIENAHQFTSLQEAERKLIQSRDQDLLSISQVLLHRLGNAGDVSYHIEKINGVLDDKSGQSSLLHIEQRISRLLDLLPSLQTVVQLDEVSFQPLNLRELIQSAFDGCTTCHHHRLTYVPVLSNVAIEGDWGTLSDAFQSVIENGCEAMAGKGEVLVTVVLDFDSDRVRVRIRDSGMGIPQRIHKKIFDLGFTTKSAEQNRRGRGLFTCRAILRKHRGDIELVDTGPQGTAFEIVLPRVSDPNAEVG